MQQDLQQNELVEIARKAVRTPKKKPQKRRVTSKRIPAILLPLNLIQRGRLDLSLPDGKTAVYSGRACGTQADMQVHDWKVFNHMLSRGDIGLGEDYINGLWDSTNLKNFMRVAVENIDAFENFARSNIFYRLAYALKNRFSPNTRRKSRKNVHVHYDLGNDFYKVWLDKGMTYSSALFQGDASKPLKEAQQAKYQRILDRLTTSSSSGGHILEIGCGWGGFMEKAAKNNFRITGVTLSHEQALWAQQRLEKAGLDNTTEVRLQDYRELDGQYDHIVSIGMFEHVGEAFWPEYMTTVYKYLKPGGKAMIQSIIIRDDLFENYRKSSDFIREYIFPGGMLPSRKRFEQEAGKAGLAVNDVFHFGQDYAITLEKWLDNFDANMEDIKAMGYCDKFIRKWRFYLTCCAAMFRSGRINVMQVELVKEKSHD
ncbi:Cyclopropane-fatty-acyl-phospholipid synthase [hydrothermal vent metagenome]|uniref:Cyclopropane-fatty-acyl-phospholipid synthase n=1 Tax=hydrothermal vent metagenome TaxID=652676 RepID=A0A3B0T1I4_9ZZZZ